MAIVSLFEPGTQADVPVERVNGIPAARVPALHRLGVRTVRDLLLMVPRRYEDSREIQDASELVPGRTQTVAGRLVSIHKRVSHRNRNLRIVEATFEAGRASFGVIWFNQDYLVARLRPGMALLLSGRVQANRHGFTVVNPTFDELGERQLHVGVLSPVYNETKTISSRWLRERIQPLLGMADMLPDPVPPQVAGEEGLMPLGDAIRRMHFPDDLEQGRRARERFAFEEMFLLQLAAQRARRRRLGGSGVVIPYDAGVARAFVGGLPFRLTEGQRVAAHEILTDMSRTGPMNRLLQGDVGSGKTAVAAMAATMAHAAGFQTVVMAPTEILARQHHATFDQLLAPSGMAIRLLVGSTPARARREIVEGAAAGHESLLVGTHALIEDDVTFARLGLIVVDEQHRFGVAQRQRLRRKSEEIPNFLAMTATPIPRSLALTAYGDVELSELREMPPGRTPVETRVVGPEARDPAYDFVRAQVAAGRQAFVICPLIEESDHLGVRSATEEHRRLREDVFPDLRVGLLHGRMSARDKDGAMSAFAAGDVDVLVSTSVVEVGVDVPNATVMLIEGAERFGLAQLHQFRGRVGRGAERSYCLLFQGGPDEEGSQRLDAVAATPSGFDLAEMDLRMRGPGEVVGMRQHGLPEMHVADLLDDALMRRARTAASRWLDADPDLRGHPPLARAMDAYRTVFDLD